MKQLLFDFSTGRPLAVYGLVLALTVVMGLAIPRIQIDTDPENMLPASQADRVLHNDVKARFDLHDAIVVGAVNADDPAGIYNVASLGALHRLTDGILAIDGVIRQDVMSLSTVDNIDQEGAGTVRFEWMMKTPPATADEAAAIRSRVERLPFLADTLVSGDGKAAAVYVPIESKDESYRISREIQALIDGLDSNDDYHITGLPVAEDTFGFEMFVQMGISAPLAGLAIFVLMWVFFRNVTLIIAPMIVAMVTVIATMGLLIGLGFTVHIMSSMIPIFLMPIAVVDSVHIMSEFADTYKPGTDARSAIGKVVDHLYTPMLFTSVTSAVGFASLALTPIPPVQVFGLHVAFGILLAFLLTIVFIPAYVVRMDDKRLAALQAVHHADEGASALAGLLRGGGLVSVRWAKPLVVFFVAVFAVSIAGVTRIDINDNPVRWFKQDHRIRVADRVLNEHFAGTYDAYLVLSRTDTNAIYDQLRADVAQRLAQADRAGIELPELAALPESLPDDPMGAVNRLIADVDDALFAADDDAAETLDDLLALAESFTTSARYFQDPKALAYIEGLQQALADSGLVGKTNALPDLVKTVNRELRSGLIEDFRVPDSARGVAQTLLQYQSSHRPQDLWHLVTPDYRSTVIWLQLTSGDNQDMTRVTEAVDAFLANNPPPANVDLSWAGKTYINVVWQEAMVQGMVKSLMGAFVIVFLMMVMLFRSLIFGALAMLPLTITITFIYGLIGWIGKDYDMPIAVLSALTLGLSIDFAIHFLQRSRELYRQSGSVAATLEAAFEEPARAIARNAIVIAVGFTPLLFAPLVPYITVGLFLASIMAVSAAVTLVLLPAVMSLGRRWVFPAPAGGGEAAPMTG